MQMAFQLRILQLDLLEIVSTKVRYLNSENLVVFEFGGEKFAQRVYILLIMRFDGLVSENV